LPPKNKEERKTDLKLILPSPSSWPDLTTTKQRKRPEKIIPWRRYHLRLDVAVRKERSPGEVVDAIVVALFFNIATTEKTIPPCPLAVTGEEEDEINHQYQETWHGETMTLRT
jgi:hypothetical protein